MQLKSEHDITVHTSVSRQSSEFWSVNRMFSKLSEPLILMLLVWHFSGVILWDCPDCSLKSKLITPFISYLNFFGLWQGWSVFEKPRTYNGYLTAQIIYKNGTQKIWTFPRTEKMGIFEKMFKEKYRRWTNDCVSDESMSYLWPDATRYIARMNNEPGNPPRSVSIIRHWTWIDPPEGGLAKPLHCRDDGSSTICTELISAKELQ